MFGYLTILTVVGILITLAILMFLFRIKDFREILNYSIIGLILALADFIIEYLGTSVGNWTYRESIYFIMDLVPIELVFLFFSAGVIARFVFINAYKIKMPIRANGIFYILILIALAMWIREIYMEPTANMLPVSIIIGLWGISNIKEYNKEAALMLAVIATIADLIFETIIINSGSYVYEAGFQIGTPITYGLLTLGLLAIMEKMHKLDKILDHPAIKNILRLFGIYRKKYEKEYNKVKKNINNVKKRIKL
ncbi:MAG: hypothetical protein KJ906_00040 [Nanoarchaeota archaeon]|nr:hypothetical protein [Nanoarchaeota archaeon]